MEQKCANCENGKWRDGVIAITDTCIECKYVDKDGKLQPSNWKPKVFSNADRIRAMSDEELLQVLGMFVDENLFDLICNNPKRTTDCDSKCVKCISEWLKLPAEEN